MRKDYAFLHWSLTLLLGPIMALILPYLIFSEVPIIKLRPYLTFVYFGITLSLPTLVVYYLIFKFLVKRYTNILLIKSILIGLSIIGICITFFSFTNIKFAYSGIICYGLTSIIVGILLPLKKRPKGEITVL